MIKKADVLLGLFLILTCLASLLLLGKTGMAGSTVHVTVDGKPYGSYDLAEDRQIEIKQESDGQPHRNVIEIKDGGVAMVKSDCKNQVCVHEGRIKKSNQTIVCLPNHVVVTISGGDTGGIDAISH